MRVLSKRRVTLRAMGLPSGLSSLYRLFLRATSASVLHHPTATRSLRRLWRHSFVDAARVEAERRSTRDAERVKVLDAWIARWNERIDNTLQLLHFAATSRGLGHRVTRNLGFLSDAHIKSQRPTPSGRVWDPQLPERSSRYTPGNAVRLHKEMKRLEIEKVDAGIFNALGQVVRLAEGRSGVTLGRLTVSHPKRFYS